MLLNNKRIRKYEKMLQNIEIYCQEVIDYETDLTVEELAERIVESITYQ